MNDAKRKAITDIVSRVVELKIEIEVLRDEEQAAFDNMPEGLQQSDACQKMESAVAAFDAAIDGLDEVEAALEEAGQ